MAHTFDEQVIALGGVFQAASLVNQLARNGNVADSAYEATINSLLITNPESTEQVFGDRLGIQLGLRELVQALDRGQSKQHAEVVRYTLSLLHLSAKLRGSPAMMDVLATRIKQAVEQARHFGPTHSNVIKNLASIYLDTISTFSLRIQVYGEPKHLQAQENADRIRALLLAGIRAAVLWHQVGGRRWHLLFQRSRLVKVADELTR